MVRGIQEQEGITSDLVGLAEYNARRGAVRVRDRRVRFSGRRVARRARADRCRRAIVGCLAVCANGFRF